MKIRKAEEKDFEKVYLLLRKLFEKNDIQKSITRKIYGGAIKNNSIFQLVAIKNNEIVGYSSFTIMEDIQSQGKIAHLRELIISEKYRGKGVGKKLLIENEKLAKRKKCIDMELASNMKRKKAHKFYEKMKYEKTSYFFWRTL